MTWFSIGILCISGLRYLSRWTVNLWGPQLSCEALWDLSVLVWALPASLTFLCILYFIFLTVSLGPPQKIVDQNR